MIVRCPTCNRAFDDALKWTICPHPSLDEPPPRHKEGDFVTGYATAREARRAERRQARRNNPPWWLYPISPVLFIVWVCCLPFMALTMIVWELWMDLQGMRRDRSDADPSDRMPDATPAPPRACCRTNPNQPPEGRTPVVHTTACPPAGGWGPAGPPQDVRG